MEIIPAIDLRGGKCVRLYQGDYQQETVFSTDPVAVAQRWQGLGAPRLHLVDLDGAASGEPGNLSTIERILDVVKLPLQMGGGIRRMEIVERLFELGVERVILGTAALEDAQLVEESCRRFGDAIVVSLDARDGYAATHGWRESSGVAAVELLRQMAALGVRRFIYTDISRDGTLTAPNFKAIAELIASTTLPIIASGGIASLHHLERLAELGAEGAIVGKALYTGNIDLKEALGRRKDAEVR
jgi:phosphoribosylformimino-5-aminoimidazole carboxamide ribotide isomerase